MLKEIYPPKLRDFASHMENYSNNNKEALTQFELFMLKTINWNISPTTAHSWLNIYLQINIYSKNSNRVHTTSILLPKEMNKNYLKTITLIDLCLFDIESLKYSYSEIAACAMYHMIKPSSLKSTGFKFYEIESCLNWLSSYAQVINDYQDNIKLEKFSNIDPENFHNIQLYYQYLDLLVRKKKFY